MSVRRVSREDAEVVGEIHSKAWKSAYRGLFPDEYIDSDTASKRTEEFLESIKDDKCMYFLLEASGQPAGIVKTHECDNVLEIESIYILSEYRGQGLGAEAIDFILAYKPWDGIFLWVLEDNIKARRFYEKNGFKLSGDTRTINRGIELKQLRYVFKEVNGGKEYGDAH